MTSVTPSTPRANSLAGAFCESSATWPDSSHGFEPAPQNVVPGSSKKITDNDAVR